MHRGGLCTGLGVCARADECAGDEGVITRREGIFDSCVEGYAHVAMHMRKLCLYGTSSSMYSRSSAIHNCVKWWGGIKSGCRGDGDTVVTSQVGDGL